MDGTLYFVGAFILICSNITDLCILILHNISCNITTNGNPRFDTPACDPSTYINLYRSLVNMCRSSDHKSVSAKYTTLLMTGAVRRRASLHFGRAGVGDAGGESWA